MWYWHKDRCINQWNQTESPEINQHIYGQMISDKCAKTIQWEKNSLSRNGAKTTGYPNWPPTSHYPQKLTQNVETKTVKLPE